MSPTRLTAQHFIELLMESNYKNWYCTELTGMPLIDDLQPIHDDEEATMQGVCDCLQSTIKMYSPMTSDGGSATDPWPQASALVSDFAQFSHKCPEFDLCFWHQQSVSTRFHYSLLCSSLSSHTVIILQTARSQ